LIKYHKNNEKFQQILLNKSEKLLPGLHIFQEKLLNWCFFSIISFLLYKSHLETKYYTTDLEVIITNYSVFEIKEEKLTIPEDFKELLSSIEGIIFLVKNTIFPI